jgi:hypothetical protein
LGYHFVRHGQYTKKPLSLSTVLYDIVEEDSTGKGPTQSKIAIPRSVAGFMFQSDGEAYAEFSGFG